MNTPTRSASRSPSFVLLPPRTSHSFAQACRDGWRTFVQESLDWSRSELVEWSRTVCEPIARDVSRAMSNGSHEFDDFSSLDARFAERIIRSARATTVETLASFSRPRARTEFARRMHESHAVAGIVDVDGVGGYAPARANDSLVDRVLALIAADLLTNLADFEGAALCDNCGGVLLDPKPCCFSSELGRVETSVTRRIVPRVGRPNSRYTSHVEAA